MASGTIRAFQIFRIVVGVLLVGLAVWLISGGLTDLLGESSEVS